MAAQRTGFWDVEHRLRHRSERGDPLEKLAASIDFKIFRTELAAAQGLQDRKKDGRPPFDPVLKFRMLVLQAMHGLSLAQIVLFRPWPRRRGSRRQQTPTASRKSTSPSLPSATNPPIGMARANAVVMLTNMACNTRRWCWLDGRNLPA
jgi:hypothetical protein